MKRTLFFLLAIAVVYWRVFTVFFAVDDFSFLAAANGPLQVPDGVEFFAGRYFSADALFRLARAMFGPSAALFHLVPLGVHALNVALVWRVADRLLVDRRTATTTALVFAVHPVAYTPAAWLAAGFNEFPVQTLSLVSVMLLLDDFAAPRPWRPLLIAACVVAAAGFKQHAVLIPLFWIAVFAARVYGRLTAPRSIGRLVWPLALLAPFYIFFWLSVLPRMRVLYAGPYERVLDPGSLFATLAHLALAALNPLPIARESLNVLVPGAGLPLPTPMAALAATSIALGLSVAAWTTTRAPHQRGWVLVAAPLAAAWLALPASMPHHVYEYYAYLALVPIAMLWGLALNGLFEDRVRGLPAGVQLALALMLLACLWVHGARRHRTSDVVAQAGRARAIDRVVSAVADGTRVFVVPPAAQARVDTAFGRSVEALHGARGVSIVFAEDEAAAPPPVFTSAPPWQLVAVDPGPSHTARVTPLVAAEWREGREPILLDPSRTTIEQPFRAAGALGGIQIAADALGRAGCRLDYRIEARTPGSGLVGQGGVDCRDLRYGAFVTLPFATAADTPDTAYALHLEFRGREGVVRLRAAPPDVGGLTWRLLAAPAGEP